MRGSEFLDKMELIDPAYVEAADTKPKKKKKVWVKWGAMAACLSLIIVGAMIWQQVTSTYNDGRGEDFGPTVSEDGVAIPRMNVSLSASAEEAADMIAFFIYQGRCYVHYERIYHDVHFIGEYLGTATGFINEWTPADGYVDLAGSISGDFYAVKGISPEFMLCMRSDDGSVSTYINDNGITLKTGADLFEDRLRVSETCTGLTYQAHGTWYYGGDEYFILKESYEQELTLFLEALNQASFLPWQDAPCDFNQVLYHIDLTSENGMNVKLRLFPDGYVFFNGIGSVFLKMDTEACERFIALLDNGEAGIPAKKMDVSVTYDDCLSDATLGGYVPRFIPDGMQVSFAGIYYYIKRETAEVGNAKRIYIEFFDASDVNRYYSITVLDAETYEEEAYEEEAYEEQHRAMYKAESFTLEDAAQGVQILDSQGNALERSRLELGVRIGNIIVILSAKGLDAQEGYSILSSVL